MGEDYGGITIHGAAAVIVVVVCSTRVLLLVSKHYRTNTDDVENINTVNVHEVNMNEQNTAYIGTYTKQS